MLKLRNRWTIPALAALAALLYNVWPLGYILDPGVLHNSYISVLEVPHKPYAWLFILCDFLTGCLVIGISLIIRSQNKLVSHIVIAYLLFGIATVADSMVPITSKCSQSVAACGAAPSQLLAFHDMASLVAYVSIYVGLLFSVRLARHYSKETKLYRWTHLTLYLWALAGIFLGLSVVIDKLPMVSQALFLAMCGVGIIVMPVNITYVQMKQSRLTANKSA